MAECLRLPPSVSLTLRKFRYPFQEINRDIFVASSFKYNRVTLKEKPCSLLLGIEINCLWHQSRYFSDIPRRSFKHYLFLTGNFYLLISLSQSVLISLSDYLSCCLTRYTSFSIFLTVCSKLSLALCPCLSG